MVCQLTLFAQNMVLLILFRHFHSSLHNISIRIIQKHKSKLHPNSSTFPFSKLSVFHRIKFFSYSHSLNPLDKIVVNSIHIDPTHLDKYDREVPGQFDTAIIQFRDGSNDMDLKSMYFKLFCNFKTMTSY